MIDSINDKNIGKGTFDNEKELPNLPLPDLHSTLNHILHSLEPLNVNDGYYIHFNDVNKNFDQLKKLINNFNNSKVADILQSTLQKFYLKNDSYLDNLHLDINNHSATKEIENDILPRNPFLILADDALNNISQIDRSAVLIHSALRFISALKKNVLPQDIDSKNGLNLSMSPYLNLFGTTRSPVFLNGELENFDLSKPYTVSDLDLEYSSRFQSPEPSDSNEDNNEEKNDDSKLDEEIGGNTIHGITINRYEDSKHILIISKGQYYTLDVLDDENNIIVDTSSLSKCINHIICDSDESYSLKMDSTALGSLTSHSYKNWKYARKRLQKRFPQELHLIDSSLFVLVLDESTETIKPNFNSVYTANDNYIPNFDLERSANCKRLLYGTSIIDNRGYQVGSCVSRWFDKLQIVVTKDSKAAVIWDSFTCDGSVVLRFASEMYTESILRLAKEVNGNDPQFSLWPQVKQTNLKQFMDYNKLEPTAVVKKIDWSFTTILNTHVHLSETKLADLISKYDIARVSIPMGRKSAIRLGIKSDSMIQIAIQIAYYALYGKLGFTMEPISMRSFKNSRSTFINIQDIDLLKLCQNFLSSNIMDIEKLELFIKQCQKHHGNVKSAKKGNNYEKHFNALKYLFEFHKQFKLYLTEDDINDGNILFENELIKPFFQPELIVSNCGNSATTTFGITPAQPNGFGIGYIIKDDQVDLTVTSQFRQGKRFMFMLNWVLSEIKQIWKKNKSLVKNGVKISPIIDKLYDLDNAVKRASAENSTTNSSDNENDTNGLTYSYKNSHKGSSYNISKSASMGFGFFDFSQIKSASKSASPQPPIRETMENSSFKLTSKLNEIASMNGIKHHSSSAVSVPTFNEKLNTGFQIENVKPESIVQTPYDSDSEIGSSGSSSRPESRRHHNVINSKFEINFDRSDVGRKIIAYE